jgi:hypothetical protein
VSLIAAAIWFPQEHLRLSFAEQITFTRIHGEDVLLYCCPRRIRIKAERERESERELH